jgi:hypothetical protein
MTAKKGRKPVARRRTRSAAVVLAGIISSTAAAPASAAPQIGSDTIAKLSAGALRRLLLNLRQEHAGQDSRFIPVADFDSYIMHGSHSQHGQHDSHGSHGQHSSFANHA